MKSYAYSRFSATEIRALQLATVLVNKVGEANFLVRCHELARAAASVLGKYGDEYKYDVVDGMYGPIEHTWLVTDRGNILDVYVPGREPQVQLIDMSAPHAAPGFARWESAAFGRPRLSWCYVPFPPGQRYMTDPEQLNWLYDRMNS